MLKIKVKEYIRTRNGIARIKRINRFYEETELGEKESNIIETDKGLYANEDIMQHSKNIIDLIEVGDYVNGYKVTKKESTLLVTEIQGIDGTIYQTPFSQYGDDIESIVTKEQFKSVEYKIKED